MIEYREEKDSMGEVKVPVWALYGAQTQRAIDNFPVSGIRFPRVFIRALGIIKAAAAEVNAELGVLDAARASAIRAAAGEVADGKWDDHFPLDIFQTGSGTSTNMNANEVIARRASQVAQDKNLIIHPNDHVNLGQSSNDVIPTAVHLSACLELSAVLLPSLKFLATTLRDRAAELNGTVKTGRTHLMDALPIRFDQEIGGWAFQVEEAVAGIEACLPGLSRLALGGTAVGTGMNSHPDFGKRTTARIAAMTGRPFGETKNHFAAQSWMNAAAGLSAALKTAAASLMKIANDLRLMNSGPLGGIAEIELPVLQPGSSIMPGKINPVVPEAVIMACVQVMGNDVVISIANSRGEFQLNTMLPIIAHNLLQSIMILGNSSRLLAEKAVAGFSVCGEEIVASLDRNPVLVTALAPLIGYDRAAEVAKRAYEEGRKIREVAAEMTDIPSEELDRLLDPRRMT